MGESCINNYAHSGQTPSTIVLQLCEKGPFAICDLRWADVRRILNRVLFSSSLAAEGTMEPSFLSSVHLAEGSTSYQPVQPSER